jgi:hypothetical protein
MGRGGDSMWAATVQPKRFTFTRIKWGSLAESVETQVAHNYFLTQGQDGLTAQFFQFSSDGELLSLVKIVDRIIEIDGGVSIPVE